MLRPKVSIIIPCYRQAQFLPLAVDSVLAQSYSHLETIVVNDGSDDDTEAVAREFKDKILYIYKPNGGVGSARNTGLNAASGKYVLFLDADDLLHPQAVAWLVDAIADTDNCLSVMGWTEFTDTPGDRPAADKFPSTATTLAQQLLTGDIPPVHAYLVARQAVCASGGFDTTLPTCEDWDLWLRLVVFGGLQVGSVARVGAYYRRYAGSQSTNFLQMDMAAYRILLPCIRKLQAPPRPRWLSGQVYRDTMRWLRKEIAGLALGAANDLRHDGRYWESAQWLWRSVRHGRINQGAAVGALKLLPHWAIKNKLAK